MSPAALPAAQQLVEALTRDQVREALTQCVDAVVRLDLDGDLPSFLSRMRAAAENTERLALAVPG